MFKTVIETEVKNNKPIEAKSNKPISLSLSPLLSKVIEKSIHDQRNELMYSYQSNSRKIIQYKFLSQLTNMINNSAENGKHIGMMLISLQRL